MYSIELTRYAEKQYGKLNPMVRSRIRQRIEGLRKNPRPPGCRKMTGLESTWRIRVGDYRVVYEILDKHLLVLVIKIGHRRDIYE